MLVMNEQQHNKWVHNSIQLNHLTIAIIDCVNELYLVLDFRISKFEIKIHIFNYHILFLTLFFF